MKQENKELLLKDLTARVPYNTIVQIKNSGIWNLKGIEQDNIDEIGYEVIVWHGKNYPSSKTSFPISICKPYLFPISSMTDVQREEYESLCIKVTSECADISGFFYTKDNYYDTVESINYLYKNHFDCGDLIPMGLALNATNLNIY